MRTKSIAALGLAGTLIFAACSSSITEEKTKSSTNANAANVATTSVTSANQSNVNTATIANGAVVPSQPVDANAAATDAVQSPSLMQERMNKMKQAGATGPAIDPRDFALKNARPAPENSTFTSYLSDAGYEIRIFKSHPQLLRAEKRVTGGDDQTLKVFLRNGKVIQVPGQKVSSLATASSAEILSAAGVAPPSVRAEDRTTKKVPGN